ncbi:MAG: transposase, partial [candidate division WOR-3 bacterium]
KLKAKLVFIEESGFSLIPSQGTTWAPIKHPPVLIHQMSWPKLSAISALTSNPHLYLHLVDGTIRSSQVAKFVWSLRPHLSGYLFLFWNGLNAHRIRFTRKALKFLKIYNYLLMPRNVILLNGYGRI